MDASSAGRDYLGERAVSLSNDLDSFYSDERKNMSNHSHQKHITMDLEFQIKSFGKEDIAKFESTTKAAIDYLHS